VEKAESSGYQQAVEVNTIGVRHLSHAAMANRIPLVHFSTDYVFDGKNVRGSGYTVACQTNPQTGYGLSKLAGEKEVRNFVEKHLIIRVSWLFGGPTENFVTKLLKKSKEIKEIPVVDDQCSIPTYVVDIAPIIVSLISKENWGTYHLTNSGGPCSRFEWAREILKISKNSSVVVPVNSEAFGSAVQRPSFSALDSEHTYNLTKIIPPHWENATSRYVAMLAKEN
jgi:dTDP-4-dehydrorhamnose reductase